MSFLFKFVCQQDLTCVGQVWIWWQELDINADVHDSWNIPVWIIRKEMQVKWSFRGYLTNTSGVEKQTKTNTPPDSSPSLKQFIP